MNVKVECNCPKFNKNWEDYQQFRLIFVSETIQVKNDISNFECFIWMSYAS